MHSTTPRIRALAAAVALALTGALVMVGGTAPAGADTVNRVAGCTPHYGSQGRNVTMDLTPMPAGTTVAIYLYRWTYNGVQWVPQYQNQYDVSKMSSGGYWISSIVHSQLLVTAAGPGIYSVAVHFWNASNTYLGGYWSSNYCNYPT
jgi:hypothetical protein